MKKQLGRRNLTDAQKTYLIGRQYEAQKMTKGAPQGNSNAKNNWPKMDPLLKEIQLKPLQKSITLGATPSNAPKNLISAHKK